MLECHQSATISANSSVDVVGMRRGSERCRAIGALSSQSGNCVGPGSEDSAMFKVSAYDPVGLAVLGFGIVAVVALAFAFG